MKQRRLPQACRRTRIPGRAYSGINILLLWGAAIENGFSGQTWLTFRQVKALGGSVMKGEGGSMVVYADKFIPKDEQQRVEKEGGDANFVPFLKRYTVFNAAQCEGLAEELTAQTKPLPECEAIPRAEALIKATGADFRIGGDRAFYVPSQDFIRVPPQPAFFEQINYYRTCFHELGHNAAFRIMPRQPDDVFFMRFAVDHANRASCGLSGRMAGKMASSPFLK